MPIESWTFKDGDENLVVETIEGFCQVEEHANHWLTSGPAVRNELPNVQESSVAGTVRSETVLMRGDETGVLGEVVKLTENTSFEKFSKEGRETDWSEARREQPRLS